MGLLALGTPLPWDEAKKYADHVRTHGITQFLAIWERLKDRTGDELLWGDEVRCKSVGDLDNSNLLPYRLNTWSSSSTRRRRTRNYPCARLRSSRNYPRSWTKSAQSVMTSMPCHPGQRLQWLRRDIRVTPPTFHPEYGRYMLESTPGSPYTGSIRDLLSVESNMRYRCASIILSSSPSSATN